MKTILRLSAASLIAGAFALSACQSCPPPSDDASDDPNAGKTSYTCGSGTKRVGNQCVPANTGTRNSSTTSTGSRAATSLNTNGNN